MSELDPLPAAPAELAAVRHEPSTPAPARRVRVDLGRRGLAAARRAVREALRTFPKSREAVRVAAVRYGAAARALGAGAAELSDAIEDALAPALAQFPAATADELRTQVAWWAAHGYHRAD